MSTWPDSGDRSSSKTYDDLHVSISLPLDIVLCTANMLQTLVPFTNFEQIMLVDHGMAKSLLQTDS